MSLGEQLAAALVRLQPVGPHLDDLLRRIRLLPRPGFELHCDLLTRVIHDLTRHDHPTALPLGLQHDLVLSGQVGDDGDDEETNRECENLDATSQASTAWRLLTESPTLITLHRVGSLRASLSATDRASAATLQPVAEIEMN